MQPGKDYSGGRDDKVSKIISNLSPQQRSFIADFEELLERPLAVDDFHDLILPNPDNVTVKAHSPFREEMERASARRRPPRNPGEQDKA